MSAPQPQYCDAALAAVRHRGGHRVPDLAAGAGADAVRGRRDARPTWAIRWSTGSSGWGWRATLAVAIVFLVDAASLVAACCCCWCRSSSARSQPHREPAALSRLVPERARAVAAGAARHLDRTCSTRERLLDCCRRTGSEPAASPRRCWAAYPVGPRASSAVADQHRADSGGRVLPAARLGPPGRDASHALVPRSIEPTVSRSRARIGRVLGAFLRGQLLRDARARRVLRRRAVAGRPVVGTADRHGRRPDQLRAVPGRDHRRRHRRDRGAGAVRRLDRTCCWCCGVFAIGQMLEGYVLVPQAGRRQDRPASGRGDLRGARRRRTVRLPRRAARVAGRVGGDGAAALRARALHARASCTTSRGRTSR